MADTPQQQAPPPPPIEPVGSVWCTRCWTELPLGAQHTCPGPRPDPARAGTESGR